MTVKEELIVVVFTRDVKGYAEGKPVAPHLIEGDVGLEVRTKCGKTAAKSEVQFTRMYPDEQICAACVEKDKC